MGNVFGRNYIKIEEMEKGERELMKKILKNNISLSGAKEQLEVIKNVESVIEENDMLYQNQREIIASIFEDINSTMAISDLIKILQKKGKYEQQTANRLVIEALNEGILYNDHIDSNIVFVALTDEGEHLWVLAQDGRYKKINK